MSHVTDTTLEADQILTDIFRRMPLEKKWRQLGEAFQTARLLHAAGCRLRDPHTTPSRIHQDWVHTHYGWSGPVEESPMNFQTNLQMLRQILTVFDKLAIAYALGGSMASSIHGIPRFTQDADINVEPFMGKEKQLIAGLGQDYYVSLPAVQQAVRDRTSFNIINTREGFKMDVFVCRDSGFQKSVMDRRLAIALPDAPGQTLMVQSPEDVILFKLHWFRLGQETSGQQWKDIGGVLKTRMGQLDNAYLDHWARDLNVADLLARARVENTVNE